MSGRLLLNLEQLPFKKAKGTSTRIVRRTAPINSVFQKFADQNCRVWDILSKAGKDKIPKADSGGYVFVVAHPWYVQYHLPP